MYVDCPFRAVNHGFSAVRRVVCEGEGSAHGRCVSEEFILRSSPSSEFPPTTYSSITIKKLVQKYAPRLPSESGCSHLESGMKIKAGDFHTNFFPFIAINIR